MVENPYDGYAETLLTRVALPLADDARSDLEAAHRTIRDMSRADLENVAFILAALVPTTVGVVSLSWWRFPPTPTPQQPPCGTHLGFRRHKRVGEQPCQRCEDAHREYDSGRKREYRAGLRRQKTRQVYGRSA